MKGNLQPNSSIAVTIFQSALTAHRAGRLEMAAEGYRQVLSIDKRHASAAHLLGTIHQINGNLKEAEVLIRKAITIRQEPDFLTNLGNLLAETERLPEAEASYRRALKLKPDHALAHNNLGNLLVETKRLAEAEASYQRALKLNPNYAKAHNNLGSLLEDSKRLEEAEASYRRAVHLMPDYAEAHYNLGNILRDLDRLDEAVTSYLQALRIKPDFGDAHYNLGNILKRLGRLKEAEVCLQRVLQITPDFAEAHCSLGNTLRNLGRLEEAEASYRRALQIKPDYVESLNNLGVVLQDLARPVNAETSFRQALEIDPDFALAHFNLGNTLRELDRLDEAESSYRRALQIKPDYFDAQSNLLFSLNYTSHGAAHCLQEAHRYNQMAAEKVGARFLSWQCLDSPDRLRVGLVSGDLREHPVGHFLESVLTNIDPARIELFAYPTHHQVDKLSARIKPCFATWQPLPGKSDEAVARKIHDDGVHILIDLSGHTAQNRLPVFAWKPAPVQVSWLGYFATTGMAEMDYFIADPFTLPAATEIYFTERIWRLPETRLCFTAPDVTLPVSELPALTNGHLTFGCFNSLTKMNDAVVALWARILATVPGSRLYLKAGQLTQLSMRQNVMARFAGQGIGAERLLLEGFAPRAEYLAAYQRVDITLDPFPFTGGTTSAESLWMGVPVLTLAGDRLVSRQGVGLMMNAGLADWIAADADDYVSRAATHGGDLARLAALRSGLRHQVLASPVFDAARFARHFEAALHGMWGQRLAHGDAPSCRQPAA